MICSYVLHALSLHTMGLPVCFAELSFRSLRRSERQTNQFVHQAPFAIYSFPCGLPPLSRWPALHHSRLQYNVCMQTTCGMPSCIGRCSPNESRCKQESEQSLVTFQQWGSEEHSLSLQKFASLNLSDLSDRRHLVRIQRQRKASRQPRKYGFQRGELCDPGVCEISGRMFEKFISGSSVASLVSSSTCQI